MLLNRRVTAVVFFFFFFLRFKLNKLRIKEMSTNPDRGLAIIVQGYLQLSTGCF